jgi:two-component system, cell cycle sensor histidine kinase and response regulator CckA
MTKIPSEPFNNDPAGQLSSSADHLQEFIELSPLPVYVVGNNFELLLVNSAACEYLGSTQSELAGKKLSDIVRPEEFERLARLSSTEPEGKTPRGDWELRRRDGSWVWADLTLRVLPSGSWLIFASDVDARKAGEDEAVESERRRSQAQKFDALGRLAGGIAHDFNNFLAVIMLQIDMLNLQLAADSPLRHRVNEIKAVSANAAGIVRQLMAFGRKQPMSPAPVVLNNAIREVGKALAPIVGDGIGIEFDLAPELGVCFVDQNQIAQILMNLGMNAKEAMPNGGHIRIKSENLELTKPAAKKKQSPGAYIQITISDNGGGMGPETADHIFEPFFSTRETDKGAGLGLASVYGTVKQSKGYIWVESELGRGTTFTIQFPRVDQPQTKRPEVEPDFEDDSMPEGSETILLVDDDDGVRRLTASVLNMCGYDVLEASGGAEAIAIARTAAKTVHLLLTDYYMPGMDGKALVEEIKKIHPETIALFMSGETPEAMDEGVHFQAKPFTPSQLTIKIRRILDSQGL